METRKYLHLQGCWADN